MALATDRSASLSGHHHAASRPTIAYGTHPGRWLGGAIGAGSSFVAALIAGRVQGMAPASSIYHGFASRSPIAVRQLVAFAAELLMTIPLISRAQVRILAEGIVEPLPAADDLPVDLLPTTQFDEASIRAGLPSAGGFGRRDLRWCGGR